MAFSDEVQYCSPAMEDAMTIRPILLSCGLLLGTAASADDQQAFEAAYQAYRDAVAAQQYHLALEPAAEARRLGESLYPDDLRKTATLVFNHGAVLGNLRRHHEAYPVLNRSRKLMRRAFGEDAQELLNVELALLDSAPPQGVRGVMEEALKLAAMHRAGDSGFIAGVKLKGALRLWGEDATSLLGEAAELYRSEGDSQGFALAQFWIGKKRLAGREYRRVPDPLNAAIEALPDGDRLALMAHAHLVEAYEQLGESQNATAHCLAIGRAKPWTDNDDYQPLFRGAPSYPAAALRSDREGSVVLEFTVDEAGFVRNPKVVDSKGGKVFHEPAIEAAKRFRYAPRFVDGKAVAVAEVRNRIIFDERNAPRDGKQWTREPVAAVTYYVPLIDPWRAL